MTHNLPTHLTFEGVDLTIIDHKGRPWLATAELARALGYATADAVSKIYRRNADEFLPDMVQTVKLTVWKRNKGLHAEEAKAGADGDLQSETRIFSPRGCYLIAMLARTERAKAFRRWVLDVLDHLAEPKTQPQRPALEDKTAETDAAFERELGRAINQRAHSLSLRQFDDIRAELRRVVKKYGAGKTQEEILAMVRGIELTDSGFYIVRRGDFRHMTSRCAVAHMMSEDIMETIHKLEAETGAELYGRHDPSEARA